MLSGKLMIIRLMQKLLNNTSSYKMNYYPEIGSHSRNEIKVESDLSSNAKNMK